MRLIYLSCSKWCPTAVIHIWTRDCTSRCTLYNMAGDTLTHTRSDPGLLETVPSRNHCCQQSCTVDKSIPSLPAISKKIPPSRNPIMQPCPNSVSC
ncbi:hypothetical protein AVEN_34204-1 [Araneus ventricosus]|uniref:Uncharacterized protein n=1 Tax=Araneus ventricosus TaxID=182803 RepID=A0A4Y2S9L3_ARAVE|nr:hypothetical protein AVEN_34204-1 [Araneus ventricosus]